MHSRMADDGYHVTMPARLGAQNTEAILGVVICNALTKPASTSWADGSGCGFMAIDISSVSRWPSKLGANGQRAAIVIISIWTVAISQAVGFVYRYFVY